MFRHSLSFTSTPYLTVKSGQTAGLGYPWIELHQGRRGMRRDMQTPVLPRQPLGTRFSHQLAFFLFSFYCKIKFLTLFASWMGNIEKNITSSKFYSSADSKHC